MRRKMERASASAASTASATSAASISTIQSIMNSLFEAVDLSGTGRIAKEDYILFTHKLYETSQTWCPRNDMFLRYKCLRSCWDTALPHRTPSALEAICEKDWDHDRAGNDDLDRRRFALSLFQLADAWTTGVDPGLFLRKLYEEMFITIDGHAK